MGPVLNTPGTRIYIDEVISRRTFLRVLGSALLPMPAFADSPRLFFLDTDLDSDIDDLAMVALLLGLNAPLIGATVASNIETAAPCMRALLDSAGLTSIPVGAYQGSSIGGGAKSLYTGAVRDRFRPGETRGRYREAVIVMREALAAAPDQSVTIVTGGTLTNVAALLSADRALVAAKCSKIVAMGGNFADPEAQEHNILFDVPAANHVAHDSPVPVYWAGYEVGAKVFTTIPPGSSPFSRAWGLGASLQRNGTRQSWDLMAVLYAVGADNLLKAVPCTVSFDDGGSTIFQSGGPNFYLSKIGSDEAIRSRCQSAIDSFIKRIA